IEEDFGRPLEAIFLEFARAPVAAASLAQVHRARLLDGREVAVKVRYPDIDEIVSTDLAASRVICQVYERLDPQPLPMLPLLEELQKYLRLELDFEREVENAVRIRAMFARDRRVVVPEMFRDHCTRRVITMEFLEGIKVTDHERLAEAGIDPREVVNGLT